MKPSVSLYAGNRNKILDPVQDAEKAAWIILVQDKTRLNILNPTGKSDFFRAVDMFAHFLEGHFSKWTQTVHYPRSGLKANGEFNLVKGSDYLTSSIEGMKFLPIDEMQLVDGKWYELYKGKALGQAAPARALYHNRVNKMLDEQSFGICVLGYYRSEYIRGIQETLQAEPGTIFDTKNAKILQAQEEDDIYRIERPFIDNGEGDKIGAKAQTPKLNVREYPSGALVDMYTKPVGTEAHVVDSTGQKRCMLTWLPNDPLYLDSWSAIRQAKTNLRVEFVKS